MSEINGQKFADVSVPEDAIIMGRVDVVMYLRPVDNGVLVATVTDDGSGDSLPLVNTLGMLEMAKKIICDLHGKAVFTNLEDNDD